jgi:hypothetical protein
MQGQENAYNRQLTALNSMSGLFGTALGTKATENIVGKQGIAGKLITAYAAAQ